MLVDSAANAYPNLGTVAGYPLKSDPAAYCE